MAYRSFQGKEIDMEKLMRQHELTQAVSNKKVNARGDQLGAGGKIVKRREEVIAEYYEANPKAATKARPVAPSTTVQTTEPPVVKEQQAPAKKKQPTGE